MRSPAPPTVIAWIAAQDLETGAKVALIVSGVASFVLASVVLAWGIYVTVVLVGMDTDVWLVKSLAVLLLFSLVPVALLAVVFVVLAPGGRLVLLRLGGAAGVIYAVGSGAIGLKSAMARRSFERANPRFKECPDCAEEVKLEAHVCRHCGYRFEVDELRGKTCPRCRRARKLDASVCRHCGYRFEDEMRWV